MTEMEPQSAPLEELPEALTAPRSRISMVWLIPVVALLIGVWLGYQAYLEQGPIIEIQFKSAEGLQKDKTKVKLKGVDIGTVKNIEPEVVEDELRYILVTAELDPGSRKFLTENTRFWVERARVSASRVSGLDTIMGGAYIAMDPVLKGNEATEFVGLEEPPPFSTSEPGKKFVLRSASLGSLSIGSPVYFRSIQVGQVVGYRLDDDGTAVSIEIFVAAPNDKLVLTNTRFWNASGLDFKISADGIQFDTQSLLSVLIGGIAFDTQESLEEKGEPALAEQYFPLYASRDEAHEKTYLHKERYLMYFEGSVRGLKVGAPVMLHGIKIGQVLDVQLQFSVEDLHFRIPVLIELEPDRIEIVGNVTGLKTQDVVARLVDKGMRGQLKSGSLLTGQLFVDLDFHPKAQPATITDQGAYQVLPTVAAPLDAIATKANQILDTLQGLPLEEIGNDLRDTIKGAKEIANSKELERSIAELELTLKQVRETARDLNKDVVPPLSLALKQAQVTLKSVEEVVARDSALYLEVKRVLREISAAARSVRGFADYLERHPEALIKGKGRQ